MSLSDPVLSPERVERVTISSGEAGIDETVDHMARAAMGQWGAGSPRIRDLAISIIHAANVPEKDSRGEIAAVHDWVKGHLRYVRDPLWYEFITYPETLAFERADGDCDDFCVLEAALLGSIGIPSRFVVWGFKGGNFSHVSMQAMAPPRPAGGKAGDKGGWISLDPIVKTQPVGWEPPDATSRKAYDTNSPKGAGAGMGGDISQALAIGLGTYAIFAMYRRALRSLGD